MPCLLLVWTALALAAGAAAEPLARIAGQAKDESGLVLAGATVDVHGGGTGRTATTDVKGAFEIVGLQAGSYQVGFRLPGFATSVRWLELAEGDTARVEVILRVALNADVLVSARRTFQSLTDLDEPVNGLIGLASAGSQGVVTAALIEARPVFRAGEVFESVPGVVISQHSGEGKANQYYVRGFNIDHGTAEEGDFSAAGSINVNYLNLLDRPLFKLEGGQDRFGRVLFAASSNLGSGHLLYAGELSHADGPWVNPDHYRKLTWSPSLSARRSA